MEERRAWVIFVLAICVVGCRGQEQNDLLPLEVGKIWTYQIRVGMDKRVEPVKVSRETPVDGVNGYELKGLLGDSRLAWKNGQLITDSGAHGRLRPHLPLLDINKDHLTWHGSITTISAPRPAYAKILRTEEKAFFWNNRKTRVTRSTVILTLPDKEITLDTWFLKGVGIVKQEQRTGIRLDTTMTLVD